MDLSPPPMFRSAHYLVTHATQDWEKAGAAALRHQVFCEEQRLFAGHDRDAIDAVATPIVALSTIAGQPDGVIGTVRIHHAGDGLWWGSRLAVTPSHRSVGIIGPALIRLAVSTAHAQGCTRFHAQVQIRNELLFRRMKWQRLALIDLHGAPHALMQADLAHYPPLGAGQTGFHAHRERRAA